jgi:DNA helicase-2/ATP-dependent DNA helicase PcrA
MWGEVAVRRAGATRAPDDVADIVLSDGRRAWVDGGPREALDSRDLGAAVVSWESVEDQRLHVERQPVQPDADLAPDQEAAVAHRRGPARIIAPAGSGKTRVLTERLRHLLVDRGWEPGKVLAVAYNVRARGEMEARCADFSPKVQTLNALGYEIVREARGATGVLEEREQREILAPLLPPLERRMNTDPMLAYLQAISAVRQCLLLPRHLEARSEEIEGLSTAFPAYRARMRDLGAVDYDEQLYAAVEALLTDGELRRRWQKRCRHLLVDEFQDLTPLHLLLVRLLALPALDVFGVGDDDQVIYGHAGADPAFLIDFARHFPGAALHALETNYRCPKPVVTAASKLLEYNSRRVSKTIRAADGAATEEHRLRIVEHPPEEALSLLLEQVRKWTVDGAQPHTIAILTRVNALLLGPQVALLDQGLPVNSTLQAHLFERTGARAALAYLRLACAGQAMSGADLELIYRRPSRGLPIELRDIFRERSTWAMRDLVGLRLSDRDSPKKWRLVRDLEGLQKAVAAGEPTRAILMRIRSDIGLGKAMATLDAGQMGELSSHADDLEALEHASTLQPDPRQFESWLRSVFRRSADPAGVVLATVHKSKGQEWDHVVVYAAVEGLMPHRLAANAIEEERRVLHVAVTRGRQEVVVLADRTNPSRFLDELRGLRKVEQPEVHSLGQRRAQVARARGPEVVPAIGETLIANGGHQGVVIQILHGGITLRTLAGARLMVHWGERIHRGETSGYLTQPVATAAGRNASGD